MDARGPDPESMKIYVIRKCMVISTCMQDRSGMQMRYQRVRRGDLHAPRRTDHIPRSLESMTID